MRRYSFPLSVSALLGLVLAVSVFAQDAPAVRVPGHRHWRECLSILDLNDQQKTEIAGILEAAKPTVQADVAAVRAARQTLRAALEVVPPDACAIGADALAVKAAVATLRAERDGVRAQIVATLTPDQQSRFQGCLDAPRLEAAAADETGE
jgi:Spy/CpxP family protein refolding chaperone